jgi:phosphoglycolate phosphatase
MAAIIFDFDGTIADSRDYIINFIAKESGRGELSLEEKHALYGMSILSIARRLGYRWWRLQKMAHGIINIKPFDGIVGVIKKLHAEGHELFIVSSNSVITIRSFLKRNHIREQFLEVYGGIEIFGKSPIFRQLIGDHNLNSKQVICIGDELRDIEAGQAAGIATIAVTWGFAGHDNLINLKPTAVAEKPEDIITILEEL